MPGPNYTREFGYNEESQLLSISHSGTLAYQYAYGADGNRRWAKDIANNAWTWYPCGVACGAGELVEQGSDLTGATWTTNAQYLRAGGGCSSMLIRQKITNLNDEYHHVDLLGVFGVITGANAAVLSSRVFDKFAVMLFLVGDSLTRNVAVGLSSETAQLDLAGRLYAVPSRMVVLNNRVLPPTLPRGSRRGRKSKLLCDDICEVWYYEDFDKCANEGLLSKLECRIKAMAEYSTCLAACTLRWNPLPRFRSPRRWLPILPGPFEWPTLPSIPPLPTFPGFPIPDPVFAI